MKIGRTWSMPSIWTFSIPAMREPLDRYVRKPLHWADPFAGKNSPAAITNDIEDRGCRFQMDGLEFLQSLKDGSLDGVIFDPPYSSEQCLRRYKSKVKGTMGRTEYLAKCKDEIARVVRPQGMAISYGWDTVGMGKRRGFVIQEIVIVCHGAGHNDTLITVDQKLQ